MITCNGLVVGAVTSTDKYEVLKQCVEFLHTYKNLQKKGTEFFIDNEMYCNVRDTWYFQDGYFGVYFKMYTGFAECVQIKVA